MRAASLLICLCLTFGYGRYCYIPFGIPSNFALFIANGLWITALHFVFCLLLNFAYGGSATQLCFGGIMGSLISINSQLWTIRQQLLFGIGFNETMFLPFSIYLYLFSALLSVVLLFFLCKNKPNSVTYTQRVFFFLTMLYLCFMGHIWHYLSNRRAMAVLYLFNRAALLTILAATFIYTKGWKKKRNVFFLLF